MIANRARPGKAIAISAIITLLMLYSPFIEDRITGGWSFWYYDRLFPTYMIYWVGGMFAGIYYDKFMAFTKDFRAYLFMIAIAAGIADVVVLYMRQHGIISSLHADAVHALYCCAVIPACFPAAWYIRHISDMLLVRMVDTSSYYIYLFHVLLIFILDNNWLAEHGDWGITSVTRLFSVRCAIVYAEVFLMAFIIWAVKRLRNKTQMFPAS